jgi:hypothetical protein
VAVDQRLHSAKRYTASTCMPRVGPSAKLVHVARHAPPRGGIERAALGIDGVVC